MEQHELIAMIAKDLLVAALTREKLPISANSELTVEIVGDAYKVLVKHVTETLSSVQS